MKSSFENTIFHTFNRTVSQIEIPSSFTFPFFYTPHPLALEAVAILQHYIANEANWDHNFGLENNKEGLEIGKMFGVLVVKNAQGEIGFLCTFSGKLANANHHDGFVPPIFDMLTEGSFFRTGEVYLNEITLEIATLEKDEKYLSAVQKLQQYKIDSANEIQDIKEKIKINKANRDAIRKTLNENDIEAIQQLKAESVREQGYLKHIKVQSSIKIEELQKIVSRYEDEIENKKLFRKQQSNALQDQLFAQYDFLNIKGARKNVKEIFEPFPLSNPPAGAGECATPKLLQYAFQHNMLPLAMAEFWWGKSPASEIRKHKFIYPACRGKCEPILAHMLDGMKVDDNPLLIQEDLSEEIKIIYEDEQMLVLNKPSQFLSVPGKHITLSVLEILKSKYPNATGPLLVHRLDMDTSGILIAAKTKEAHQNLQSQFIKKSVEKRYIALLDKEIDTEEGIIDLPIRVDLDNRPHQLVCYEYGKRAVTKYKVLEKSNGKTRIYFYPITGRTHQLRMHASHPLGLNAAIVGDDLYGKSADRLHLHANYIKLVHPLTRQEMIFECECPF